MYRSAVILFAFIFLSSSLSAQTTNYRFKNLSTIDGISQSSVIEIQQDKLCQIWLGTRDGLNKFDGSGFTIFRNNPEDSFINKQQ